MQGLHCWFCGKRQDEVKRLIAGPTAYICNECVMLCVDILNEDVRYEVKPPRPDEGAHDDRDRPWEPPATVLVHLAEATTVAIRPLVEWTPFLHGDERLEWVAGRAELGGTTTLVVGVRAQGYSGAALGLQFSSGTELTESLVHEVARARRGGA